MSPLFKSAMLLSVMLLAACSESPESTFEEQVQSTQVAPEASPPKASATSGGGYVPSDSERIPGITLTQEELDKMYAEARANTPTPVIPEDAK